MGDFGENDNFLMGGLNRDFLGTAFDSRDFLRVAFDSRIFVFLQEDKLPTMGGGTNFLFLVAAALTATIRRILFCMLFSGLGFMFCFSIPICDLFISIDFRRHCLDVIDLISAERKYTSFTKSTDNITWRKSFQIGLGRQLCNYISINSVTWILPHISLALNIVHGFERSKACNIQWLSYMRCVWWKNIKYNAMLFAPVCQCKRHM